MERAKRQRQWEEEANKEWRNYSKPDYATKSQNHRGEQKAKNQCARRTISQLLSPGLKGNFKAATYLLDRQTAFQKKADERQANRALIPEITKDMTPQEAANAYAHRLKDLNAEWED